VGSINLESLYNAMQKYIGVALSEEDKEDVKNDLRATLPGIGIEFRWTVYGPRGNPNGFSYLRGVFVDGIKDFLHTTWPLSFKESVGGRWVWKEIKRSELK